MFIFDAYENDTAEPNDEILTFDVPDDALRVLSGACQRTSRNYRILHSLDTRTWPL
jgi:hypothetical protein